MTYKEALEKIATVNAMDYEYQAWAREALASKQEQRSVSEHLEPVAWMYQCSADSSGPVLMQHKKDWAESGSGLWTETPLFTTPPPQRPWIGLTEQERNDMEDFCEMIIGKVAFDAIEAKLKEKNT